MSEQTIYLNRQQDAPVVSEGMFGGIFTTFQSAGAALTDYTLHADAIGLTHLRWPGGKLAKDGQDRFDWDGDGDTTEYAYSLSLPDVHLKVAGTGNSEFGLSGLMAQAVATDQPASMIVPVARYYDDIAAGQAELETFLARLVGGAFGEIPADFTLELGNENISKGAVDEAIDYALASDAFLYTIRKFLGDRDKNPERVELKVAIQGGQDSETDTAVRSIISPKNYDQIDAVRFHYLNLNIRDGQTKAQERAELIAEWDKMLGRDVEVYASAWTVGASQYTDNAQAIEFNDFGAAMGRSTISSIVQMVENGVDKAAVWGVDLNLDRNTGLAQNPNWFTTGKNGEVQLSNGGHALQLMAEGAAGKALVYSSGTEVADGSLINGHFPGLPSVSTYAFEDETGLTIFLAGNDVAAGGETFRLNLGAFVWNAEAEVARITTDFNDAGDKYDDVAIRSDATATISAGSLDVRLTQDYELVRVMINYGDEGDGLVRVNRFAGTSDNDLFVADHRNDTINDVSTADRDRVVSAVDFDLASRTINVENLSLQGAAVVGGGNALSNVIVGNTADNLLRGLEGNDTILGDIGNDSIRGDVGNDNLKGGDGRDTVLGGVGDDVINGGSGGDSLQGNSGKDRINGNDGNDTITGGGADDRISGGGGDDDILGNIGRDTLFGNGGQDTLYGSFGPDDISGGDGNDFISAGSDVDRADGDAGNDTIYGNEGADSLYGGIGNDVLYGGSGVDMLHGEKGNDTLLGMEGADWLYGLADNDLLRGGSGDDTLRGGNGNDKLYGNQGLDVLVGGDGDDTLRGGTLKDHFVFDSGHDVIEDFRAVEDILQLDSALWSGTLSAQQVVSRFGTIQQGDVVLDFGDEHSVRFLEDISMTALTNAIEIL